MVEADLTQAELYPAGTEVPLAGLPNPRDMASLVVGAANLSERIAFCQATLFAPDGSRLAEIPFEVEPMSLARRDGLAAIGRGRVAVAEVTCDQSFYPFAVTAGANGLAPIVAKGTGPNGPCGLSLKVLKQPNGHYTTASPTGVFHDATKTKPKGILCIKVPQELRIAKAVFEWDTTVGPWSSRNRSGLHNLAYFFLDRYRSGVIGNINAAGPSRSFIKFMQNVGMAPGTNTNNMVNYALLRGATYHQIYTFDAAHKLATLQMFLNGLQVVKLSKETKPGNNQTLVVRPYGTGDNVGLAMVAEFGNYLGQAPPEEATVGWKYASFKLDMTPK